MGGDKYIGAPKSIARGDGRPRTPPLFQSRVTPVTELPVGGSVLWVKRDDETHELYGGNKVRKLSAILSELAAEGSEKIVTVGAAGSHHVLATCLFGAAHGFHVEAVLVPQARSHHAEGNLARICERASRVTPVRGYAGAALAIARAKLGSAAYIPFGGSCVEGALGYVAAAHELAAQVRDGVLPEPAEILVTVGSGGTVAGLAVGLEELGLGSRVVAVVVAEPPWLVARLTERLARTTARRVGLLPARDWFRTRVSFDTRYLGEGYGRGTPEGARAAAFAKERGLMVDPTYTEKTLAAALDYATSRAGPVLFWHTLSSRVPPLAPPLDEGIARRLLID